MIQVEFSDIEVRHHYSGTMPPIFFNWTITMLEDDNGFFLDRFLHKTMDGIYIDYDTIGLIQVCI